MSTPNPDQRRRIVDDALTQAFPKKPKSQADFAYDKAKTATEAVRSYIKPILQAGGWKEPENVRQTVCKLYLEAFDAFSKEELVYIIAGMHVELMLESIKKSPFGNPTPDLLS